MNMIHAPLDPHRLKAWSNATAAGEARSYDPGFALHMLLCAMFGKRVLQPFRLFHSSRRPTATLYAYTTADPDALRDLAATVAPPDHLSILDPGRISWKAMPDRFRAGQLLGFDIKTRPIERLRVQIPKPSDTCRPVTRERDYFPLYGAEHARAGAARNGNGNRHLPGNGIGACPSPDDQTREGTYAHWLGRRLGGAAEVVACRLAAFYRTSAYRGRSRAVKGPDATMHGTVRITDPAEFARKLANGVGRHKAYGYGMLLLRPPDAPPMRG